jgi:hypothetical protein
MKTKLLAPALIALLLLPSCAPAPEKRAALATQLQAQVAAKSGNIDPRPSSFIVCHGHGCRLKHKVALTSREWSRIAAQFNPGGSSPKQERDNIRRAIGIMEKIVGPKTDTAADVAGTFDGAMSSGQLDCEDEMLNTATYFTMMAEKGLIRRHRLSGRAHRGFFVTGWPHMAVQIEEVSSGKQFVLDSWFHDNGQPAEVVELSRWRDGWRPADSTPRAKQRTAEIRALRDKY